MARARLHNDDWGYESNCFVCEQRNERGLRIPFFHDTDRDVVTSEFELGFDHSGAPTLVHGGVTLAVLDEAMAWACIAVGRRWAVTSETTTRFERAVLIDRPHTVEAWLDETAEETILAGATITDPDGATCATATATFTILGEAQLRRFSGGDRDPR